MRTPQHAHTSMRVRPDHVGESSNTYWGDVSQPPGLFKNGARSAVGARGRTARRAADSRSAPTRRMHRARESAAAKPSAWKSGKSGDTINPVRHGNCLGRTACSVSRRTGLGFHGWSTFECRRQSQRSVNLRRARAREGPVRIGPRVLRCASATPLRWPGR
jgi:hypothetical protein